eukprot:TRINITY_DN347_c0_g1_i1.p1 TRINITY_DN347_c0_g1~~TRINITY_DN347_c0_g1_i1.p1  ORF type:complete len:281 (+),score=2.81 TRINITY_DN347_c0_g1_i1:70-843(+)
MPGGLGMAKRAARMGARHAPDQHSLDPDKERPWDTVVKKPEEQNEWQIPFMKSCVDSPGSFLMSCFCSPCYAFAQRQHVMQHNWDNFICCSGYSFGSKVPMQSNMPCLCLALEVTCCLACSIRGSRHLIGKKYHIKSSRVEDCIIHCCVGRSRRDPMAIPRRAAREYNRRCALCFFLPDNVTKCDVPESRACFFPFDPCAGCFLTQMQVELDSRSYPDDTIGKAMGETSDPNRVDSIEDVAPSGGAVMTQGDGQHGL